MIETPTLTILERWQRTWQTFMAMWRKELLIMLRYPVEFVASFGQIFLVITVFVLAGSMFTPREGGAEAVNQQSGLIVYGFILFIFLSDTLWTVGYNVRREQKQGTLEQLYLSPAAKLASLSARVAITLLWTGLLAIMAAFALQALLGQLPFHNVPLGAYILVMALAGTFGTGFAFAAWTLRIKETAATLSSFFQFAFMVFCAPFFPFAALPDFLLPVVRLIPLAYGVDAFRATMMDYPTGFPELAPMWVELIIVTAFGVLMPLAGLRLYKRAEDRARRVGSLSEY